MMACIPIRYPFWNTMNEQRCFGQNAADAPNQAFLLGREMKIPFDETDCRKATDQETEIGMMIDIE